MADILKSPYEFYLDLLGEWATGVALPSLWFCYFNFDNVGALRSDLLQNQLKAYEAVGGNWNISGNTIARLTDGRLQYSSNSLTGCVFAKQVDLPSDEVSVQNDTLKYGGYTAPATASERRRANVTTVTFLETNASFLDLVIRPWVVLVGYNGLIARSPNSYRNVKCSEFNICMLAKAGANVPLKIRKIFRFTNVAPSLISGESYAHTTDSLKTSKVNFTYDTYSVLEQDTPSMIDRR